jgi:hypothetical protein
MNRSEMENLMAAWLAGDLDKADEQRLESFVAAYPDALRELAAQKSMDGALRVLLDSNHSEQRVTDSVTSVLRAKSCKEFQSDLMRRLRGGVSEVPPLGPPGLDFKAVKVPKTARSSKLAAVALAVCAVALIGWMIFTVLPDGASAFIASASPGVLVERGTTKVAAGAGFKLRASDVVRTGKEQSIQIAYRAESTRLELKENSELHFLKSWREKRLNLLRGNLSASVDKQPLGKPMVIATPQAEAQIVGTRFILNATRHSTRLEVAEGVVNLVRLFDAATIRVEAEQFAVAARGVELLSRPVTGEITPGGPLPVKLQLFSEYKNDDLWRVSRGTIQQTQVETARRSFQFQPLEGSYWVEVLITVDQVATVRNSQTAQAGFGVGLARWQPTHEKLQPFLYMHASQHGDPGSNLGFWSEWPPGSVQRGSISLSPRVAYHVKLMADALESGKTRLRGKIWAAGEREPTGWMADSGLVTLREPFDQIVLSTSDAAATFKDLKLSFIE